MPGIIGGMPGAPILKIAKNVLSEMSWVTSDARLRETHGADIGGGLPYTHDGC